MKRIAAILAREAYTVERHVLNMRMLATQAQKIDYASARQKDQSLIRLASLLRQAEKQASALRRDAAWFRGEKA